MRSKNGNIKTISYIEKMNNSQRTIWEIYAWWDNEWVMLHKTSQKPEQIELDKLDADKWNR